MTVWSYTGTKNSVGQYVYQYVSGYYYGVNNYYTTVYRGDTYDDGKVGSVTSPVELNPVYTTPSGDQSFPSDYVSDNDFYTGLANYYTKYSNEIANLKAQIAGLEVGDDSNILDKDSPNYYDLPSKLTNIQNTLSVLSSKTGLTLTELKNELVNVKASIVSLAGIQSLVSAEASKRAAAEAAIKVNLDAIQASNKLVHEAELKTYALAEEIKNKANQIYALSGVKSGVDEQYFDNVFYDNITDAFEEATHSLPIVKEITDKFNLMADNLSKTIIPQAMYNAAMLIPNLSEPIDSEKFLATMDQMKTVADVLEMAAASYIIANEAFAKDESGRIANFNLALTEFRTGVNLLNTFAQNKGFYGAYVGGGAWEYSTVKRDGFLKSKYGNYYVRKRLS